MPWQKEGQEVIRTHLEQFFFGEGAALPPGYVPERTVRLYAHSVLPRPYCSCGPRGSRPCGVAVLFCAVPERPRAPGLRAARYGLDEVAALTQSVAGRTPEQVAADEDYWREIQFAFTLDRTLINLNNGNQCPSPTVVHEACKRYMDWANQAPVYHRGHDRPEHRDRPPPAGRGVRRRPRGDRHHAQRQRVAADRADGPRPRARRRDRHDRAGLRPHADDLGSARAPRQGHAHAHRLPGADHAAGPARAARRAPSRRAPRCCTSATSRISRGSSSRSASSACWARARGIITIVDGAHAMGHFPYKLRDLEMDYYGVSLHKWLLAPLGTGLLYVRRDRIASTWPLQAAPDRARQRHPQVRGDRHASARAAGRDQRGRRVPAGDRHRAQGGAAALPDAALGQRAEEGAAHQAALEPRAGPDLGPRRGLHRRRRQQQAGHPPLGQAPHRHRRGRATRTRRSRR